MKKYQNAFNESDVNKTIFPGGFCVPGVRKILLRLTENNYM